MPAARKRRLVYDPLAWSATVGLYLPTENRTFHPNASTPPAKTPMACTPNANGAIASTPPAAKRPSAQVPPANNPSDATPTLIMPIDRTPKRENTSSLDPGREDAASSATDGDHPLRNRWHPRVGGILFEADIVKRQAQPLDRARPPKCAGLRSDRRHAHFGSMRLRSPSGSFLSFAASSNRRAPSSS